MALKPTIYKFRIALTDINNDHYDSLNLTVAQHPSENNERMMARVLAYCLNAQPDLQFTKGLSSIEEPDIWVKSLDDQLLHWIEAGEPDFDRVKKASRIAKRVSIYNFNTKTDVWWKQNQTKFATLNAEIFRLDPAGVVESTKMIARTLDLGVMISGNTIYLSTDALQCEVTWEMLSESK